MIACAFDGCPPTRNAHDLSETAALDRQRRGGGAVHIGSDRAAQGSCLPPLAAPRSASSSSATVCRITPDDRLVAAFAPFALYGPALGIGAAVPRMDVTRPGTLTADALADAAAVGRGDPGLRVAGRAAQRGRHRKPADRPSSAHHSQRIRLVLSAGAPVAVPLLRRPTASPSRQRSCTPRTG